MKHLPRHGALGALIGFSCLGSAVFIDGHVDVYPDARAAIQDPEPLVGVTVPSRSAEIAPEQDGTIVEMPVIEGARVETGHVLFKLNSSLFELEVDRLQAIANTDLSLLKAKATLDQARKRENRLKALQRRDVASTSELQDSQTDAEIAELQMRLVEFERAQALNQWKQARERLDKRTLRSPIDGIVAEMFKRPGEAVERLTPVLRVITLDPLWVEFECPIGRQDTFKPGRLVTVSPATNPADTRTVEIVYVAMEANPSSHTFLARAAIPNSKHRWRAGLKMLVRPASGGVGATPPVPEGK